MSETTTYSKRELLTKIRDFVMQKLSGYRFHNGQIFSQHTFKAYEEARDLGSEWRWSPLRQSGTILTMDKASYSSSDHRSNPWWVYIRTFQDHHSFKKNLRVKVGKPRSLPGPSQYYNYGIALTEAQVEKIAQKVVDKVREAVSYAEEKIRAEEVRRARSAAHISERENNALRTLDQLKARLGWRVTRAQWSDSEIETPDGQKFDVQVQGNGKVSLRNTLVQDLTPEEAAQILRVIAEMRRN